MAQDQPVDIRTSRMRKKSDDVKSLDSWSEITERGSISSRTSLEDGGSDATGELMLSPGRLPTIEEPTGPPPEPQVTRVKLQKSEGESSRGHKFFHIPHLGHYSHVHHGSPGEYGKHKKHKHFRNKHRHRSPDEEAVDGCDNARNHQLHNFAVKTKYGHRHHREHIPVPKCGCDSCVSMISKPVGVIGSHTVPSRHLRTHNSAFNRLLSKGKLSEENNDDNDIEHSEKMKNKLMSVWNNMKYGWTLKTKTNFEKDSPIFLLGCCYHKRPEDLDPEPGEVVNGLPHSMELFKQDFQSRLWFTYRRDFQPMPNTKLTTDCGWGCMLRSSQMMMAQAFVMHFLGRDWRAHHRTTDQERFYRTIIQWFGDSMSDQCPFSVHRLSDIGKAYGKQPGEWYGPSSVAYIVKDTLQKASLSQPVLKDLCVYVAQDCTVYKQDVLDLCTSRARNLTSSNESHPHSDHSDSLPTTQEPASETNDPFNSTPGGSKQVPGPSKPTSQSEEPFQRALIMLVPVRLGGEEFNPIYSPCVKNLMAHDTCIGMIGGKPKHSLYFIGWQEDKLIYLDPHFCQDYVDTLKRDFKVETFHCFSPRKVSLSKMDPSATVGFYCRTRADFNKLVDHVEEMVTPKRGGGLYPMFVIQDGRSSDLDLRDLSLSVERSLKVHHVHMDKSGRLRSSTVESEEFVVL